MEMDEKTEPKETFHWLRLGAGLLLADACILVVWYFFSMFCCAPFMGGSFRGEQFRVMMWTGVIVLGVPSLLIPLGVYWLRWFFYLILAVMVLLGVAFLLPEAKYVFHSGKWTTDDTVILVAFFISFVACPLAIVLLATGKPPAEGTVKSP